MNPNDDQVIITQQLQKENFIIPKEIEIEVPNVQNLKFDEITLHTPTTSRRQLSLTQNIELDSGTYMTK